MGPRFLPIHYLGQITRGQARHGITKASSVPPPSHTRAQVVKTQTIAARGLSSVLPPDGRLGAHTAPPA